MLCKEKYVAQLKEEKFSLEIEVINLKGKVTKCFIIC